MSTCMNNKAVHIPFVHSSFLVVCHFDYNGEEKAFSIHAQLLLFYSQSMKIRDVQASLGYPRQMPPL